MLSRKLFILLIFFVAVMVGGHEVFKEDGESDTNALNITEISDKKGNLNFGENAEEGIGKDSLNVSNPDAAKNGKQSEQKKDEKDSKKHTSKIKQLLEVYPVLNYLADKIKDGATEYVVAVLLVVHVINYAYGYFRNQNLSMQWLDSVRDFIFENFSMVGTRG